MCRPPFPRMEMRRGPNRHPLLDEIMYYSEPPLEQYEHDRLALIIERERRRTILAIQLGIRQGRRNDDPVLFPSPGTP
jgi:hypothetical protein